MSSPQCNQVASAEADDEQFTVRICEQADQRTVHVVGELDLSTRSLMLRACLEGDHQSVVLELVGLTFMDCAGYSALAEAREVLERRGGSLTLAHSTGEPARLLRLIDASTVNTGS